MAVSLCASHTSTVIHVDIFLFVMPLTLHSGTWLLCIAFRLNVLTCLDQVRKWEVKIESSSFTNYGDTLGSLPLSVCMPVRCEF